MQEMPRPRKPYVQREKSRHGKTVWYFRRGDGPRIRLRGEYESPEWLADYDLAMGITRAAEASPRAVNGTVGWLIARYQDSLAFTELAKGTQRARANVLARVKKTAAHVELKDVTRAMITEGMDKRRDTPAAAVNFVKVMRALFKWAVSADIMMDNPAATVQARARKTDGHHTWTTDEVAAFCARWPVGTRERLAMDILLYTGMRGSDAVLFGRQHVRDGVIRYISVKTRVDVELPLLAPLRASLDAARTGDLTYLITEWKAPFASAASFGNWFRKACVKAGVPGRAHGLRKAGATMAAEHGASDRQLMAMWGWTTADQATLYTRKANRGKLAAAAGKMLMEGNFGNDLSPHPKPGAGENGKK
jgi:integrase